MSSPSPTNAKSPLDAAQKIVTELTGMTIEHQALALRFAIETLGLNLQLPAALSPSPSPPAGFPQTTPTQPVSSGDHSTDIRSFTSMKSPKSDQQFTAVVAYFYQFESKLDDRKEAIDADIMKEAARLAGRHQVARWNMTLTNAKNAGYLDTAGNGKFKLSSVGENLVAITLPGNGEPGRKKVKIKNKIVKKNASKKVQRKKM
jgi:hypothetical protein